MSNTCIGCGVCCTSYRVAFHWSETTAHPSGSVPLELTEPLRRHEVAMRGTNAARPRCIALAGTPGVDARCTIHGRHPGCCREVALGSSQCQRARQRFGLAALTPHEIALSYADARPPAKPLAQPPAQPRAHPLAQPPVPLLSQAPGRHT